MLKLITQKKFEKDLQLAKKRNKDMKNMLCVLNLLQEQIALPAKYKGHRLIGNYKGYDECHIEPDWLLIYKIDAIKEELILVRTGTHSDLF